MRAGIDCYCSGRPANPSTMFAVSKLTATTRPTRFGVAVVAGEARQVQRHGQLDQDVVAGPWS